MRSRLQFIVFLAIVLLIIGTANAVVWSGITATFLLTSPQALALAELLAVLSLGFIGMMILGSYYYNIFTRVVYTLLAVWMGTFAYLFFASIVLGVIALIEPGSSIQTVGLALYIFAALVSAYGVMHAKRIKVAKYEVTLQNLPAEWKNKRAVFISDLHLGQVHGPKFAAKVTKAVMDLKADLIFIGGDLYDGTGAPDAYELAEPLAKLSAPWGVLYITGNHEEFGDSSDFLAAVRRAGITILMDEKADVHGVDIVGVDYHNANDVGRFSKILSAQSLVPNKPSILLKHEPNNLAVAADAGISLQLSGHTHYGQQWPFGLLAQLSYRGYAYGLREVKNMQMLTSSGIGTWGPPLRVGSNSEIALITFS